MVEFALGDMDSDGHVDVVFANSDGNVTQTELEGIIAKAIEVGTENGADLRSVVAGFAVLREIYGAQTYD